MLLVCTLVLSVLVARADPQWHKKLEDYKFGDALKGWDYRKGLSMPFIDYCCGNYPGSIVCEYRQRTQTFKNISVLADIAKRRALIDHTAAHGCLSLPDKRSLVIQIRLGDVIVAGDCFKNSQACQGNGNKVIDSHCWPEFAQRYREEFRRPIVIVSNHHRVRNNRNGLNFSLQYRSDLVTWLRLTFNNSDVTFRENCQPDHDFVFLTQARHLLASQGGFSTLSKMTAKRCGAHVLLC